MRPRHPSDGDSLAGNEFLDTCVLLKKKYILFLRLWFRLFSQVYLVRFPTGAPAGMPAPQSRHKGFGIGFSLFSDSTGFASVCLF